MKRLFFILFFLLIAYPVMSADNSCKAVNPWKVCAAVVDHKPLYVVSKDCKAISHYLWFEDYKETAHFRAKVLNEDERASCETRNKQKMLDEEMKKANWVEIE